MLVLLKFDDNHQCVGFKLPLQPACNNCVDTLLQYTEQRIYSQLVTVDYQSFRVCLVARSGRPDAAPTDDETVGIELF